MDRYDVILSMQTNLREELDQLFAKCTALENKKNSMINVLFDNCYKYDINELLEYVELREPTKIFLSLTLSDLNIHCRKNGDTRDTIISYTYCAYYKYKFVINKDYQLKIFKDEKLLFIYDLLKEFKPLDFDNVCRQSVIENYIDLFIKNDNIKLGMIISVYFYIVTYLTNNSKNSDNKLKVIDTKEFQKFHRIFNNR